MAELLKVDRETTTPFLLKLFYRDETFHRLTDFLPTARLPPHIQIYTWQTCTLRELTQLLITALPSLLSSPAVGTRVAFRLVYPDARAAFTQPAASHGPQFLSRELGSVVVAPEDARDASGLNGHANGGLVGSNLRLDGEADKMLADARFVIGDYISCAILPPLRDGSVAPVPHSQSANWSSRGPAGGGRNGRENGSLYGGGGGGFDGGRGRGFRSGPYSRDFNGGGVPAGEWRRGERLPDGPGGLGRGGRLRGQW